jgi:electron transfer flavoprotein beta subunit
MPVTMAELLGLPSVTIARKVDLDGGGIRVERQTDAGYDVLTCSLPAVVTLTLGANDPRYPSLKGIMQAKQKPVDRLTLDDLGLSDVDVAPTQRVTGVAAAPPKPGGEIVEGDDGIAKIAALLAEAKVI